MKMPLLELELDYVSLYNDE